MKLFTFCIRPTDIVWPPALMHHIMRVYSPSTLSAKKCLRHSLPILINSCANDLLLAIDMKPEKNFNYFMKKNPFIPILGWNLYPNWLLCMSVESQISALNWSPLKVSFFFGSLWIFRSHRFISSVPYFLLSYQLFLFFLTCKKKQFNYDVPQIVHQCI